MFTNLENQANQPLINKADHISPEFAYLKLVITHNPRNRLAGPSSGNQLVVPNMVLPMVSMLSQGFYIDGLRPSPMEGSWYEDVKLYIAVDPTMNHY